MAPARAPSTFARCIAEHKLSVSMDEMWPWDYLVGIGASRPQVLLNPTAVTSGFLKVVLARLVAPYAYILWQRAAGALGAELSAPPPVDLPAPVGLEVRLLRARFGEDSLHS